MGRRSEKWEIHIGKKIHIISGEEKELILNAGSARFVKFRDLIINPAFVEQIILIEKPSVALLDRPYEGDLSSEEWLEKHYEH